MRILIISPFFYPNKTPRAYRAFELAKEFALLGHEVVVYTDKGTYNYSDISDRYKFVVKDIQNLKLYRTGNSDVVKYSIFERILLKLLKYPFYYPEIELAYRLPKAIRHENLYDLLISVASPHSSHIGTAFALKNNRSLTKTWIADCGDPFYKNSFSKFPFYFRYVEKWMFKNVDYITIPTLLATKSYPKELKKKIRVIPQGFDFSGIRLADYRRNSCPTFAYAGMLYKEKRDPSMFLDYLANIRFDFRFIIYTRSYVFFEKYREILKNKLVVKDYIDRNELIYEMSKMDFLVNFENDVKEQVPSKLIDYSFTKRPILNISSKIINTKHIDEFLSYNFQNQYCLEEIDRYNIKNVASGFIGLIKS